MWNFIQDDMIDYEEALKYLNQLEIRSQNESDQGEKGLPCPDRVENSKSKEEDVNELLEKSKKMLEEVEELRQDTHAFQVRISEADRCMEWTEKRLEDIRRQQNRSAAIIWNFPDDLHPNLIPSASQQEKTETIQEFLIKTVGVPEDVVKLIAIQHSRVFYTVYKSERSANVRLQFTDDESKSICESYCAPFFKTFNQMRPVPTRWREDQTEMQRDEEKEQRQKQKQERNGAGGSRGLLFTKFIRWPPPQQA